MALDLTDMTRRRRCTKAIYDPIYGMMKERTHHNLTPFPVPICTCVMIRELPDMGRDIREIEESSKILSASFGGNHGKDTKCNGGDDST